MDIDKLSIRNHIYVDGYAYGVRPHITGVTPWEQRLAPNTGSAYHPEPRDAVLSTVVTIDNPVTGYGVEYEVLVCADYEPAQRGGWEDESWDAYWHSPEAWYYREGRGWKRLELDKRAEAQLIAELDREAEYRRNYRD